MKGFLFIAITVILVASHSLRGRQTKRLRRVWIAREKPRALQVINLRRIFLGAEGRLACGVRRVRVSSKVMIKRNVLLKNDYDMLDGRDRTSTRLNSSHLVISYAV